jgi:hypothetical protein
VIHNDTISASLPLAIRERTHRLERVGACTWVCRFAVLVEKVICSQAGDVIATHNYGPIATISPSRDMSVHFHLYTPVTLSLTSHSTVVIDLTYQDQGRREFSRHFTVVHLTERNIWTDSSTDHSFDTQPQ